MECVNHTIDTDPHGVISCTSVHMKTSLSRKLYGITVATTIPRSHGLLRQNYATNDALYWILLRLLISSNYNNELLEENFSYTMRRWVCTWC